MAMNWPNDYLKEGYTEIQGVVSYSPVHTGEYMRGSRWPDISDSSPQIVHTDATIAEFDPVIQQLRSNGCTPPITLLSVCDGGGHPSALLAKAYPDVRVLSLDLSLDALVHFSPKMIKYHGLTEENVVR